MLAVILFLSAAAQKKSPVSLHLAARVNIMTYDRLKRYVHAGAGTGVQLYYNNKKKVKPLFELNIDVFSTNKILLVFEDGSTGAPKSTVATVLAGVAFQPVKNFETGVVAGPSFVQGNVYAGVKPFIACYFGKRQTVKAFTSLTHVFERDRISKKNSGFISAGLAVKIL